MKRSMQRMTAMVLVLCMMFTFMASAAADTRYYELTVTLTGPAADGKTAKVSRSTGRYELESDSLLSTLGLSLFMENEAGLTVDEEIAQKFAGTGLGASYAELRDGALEIISGTGHDVWDKWVNSCVDTAAYKSVLLNTDSTIKDLADIGGVITAHYTDTQNRTYTVTISVKQENIVTEPEEQEDGSERTVPEKESVVVNDSENGNAEVDKSAPKDGDTVIITVDPDDEYMLNYVDVRDENGNKVQLEYIGEGRFSFVKPEGAVSITAKFRKIPADPKVTGVADKLNTVDHLVYMVGDADGNFRPKAAITRAEVAQIFYRLLLTKPENTTAEFVDVSDDKWYAEAVNALASLGILNGTGDGRFEPNRAITRAEFAVICVRFSNCYIEGNSFIDIPDDYWAKNEINTAAELGWINGTGDGKFEPSRSITREEAAKLINSMLFRFGDQIAVDKGEGKAFPDVNDSMWSWYEIEEATSVHDYGMEEGFYREYWK